MSHKDRDDRDKHDRPDRPDPPRPDRSVRPPHKEFEFNCYTTPNPLTATQARYRVRVRVDARTYEDALRQLESVLMERNPAGARMLYWMPRDDKGNGHGSYQTIPS